MTTIINHEQRPFVVRLVRQGDRYGHQMSLVHQEAEPLVEFYDATRGSRNDGATDSAHAQFVSRYYLSTLQMRNPNYSLILDGGVREWTLDPVATLSAVRWAMYMVRTQQSPDTRYAEPTAIR